MTYPHDIGRDSIWWVYTRVSAFLSEGRIDGKVMSKVVHCHLAGNALVYLAGVESYRWGQVQEARCDERHATDTKSVAGDVQSAVGERKRHVRRVRFIHTEGRFIPTYQLVTFLNSSGSFTGSETGGLHHLAREPCK